MVPHLAWLVLATGPGWNRTEAPGPGQEPPSNPTHSVLAGLLPGPDIYPQFFGWVEPGPLFHFVVPTTMALLWLQLSISVLIIS